MYVTDICCFSDEKDMKIIIKITHNIENLDRKIRNKKDPQIILCFVFYSCKKINFTVKISKYVTVKFKKYVKGVGANMLRK